ncbi:hypothetical protein NA78x_000449 [Anatilimnocola sp. NA78]|uniref:hypothetical protein n=1 Tax=Anatilimnocola sp. NA78 TaxID=3415683 RepID=UPI003CE4AD70
MSHEETHSAATISPETQQRIDERLDAIDRALLGLVPRSTRLAITADIEARVAAAGVDATELSIPLAEAVPAVATSRRAATTRRRSQLAVTAGSLGIAGLLCLLAFPVLYILVSILADAIDETIAIGLLSTHALFIAACGASAVVFGVLALIRLSGSSNKTGHGWAITGLCTGAMPLLIGGTVVVVVGSQLVEASSVTVTPASYTVASGPYGQPGAYPAVPAMPVDMSCPPGFYPPACQPGTQLLPELAPLPACLPPDVITKPQLADVKQPASTSAKPPAISPSQPPAEVLSAEKEKPAAEPKATLTKPTKETEAKEETEDE